MPRLRTRTRWSLVVGLVVGCYLYEGQDRPVWQRDISPLRPVVRNGRPWDWDNSWRLLFAGICDHEQNVALLDTSSEPPVVLQYDLSTGEERGKVPLGNSAEGLGESELELRELRTSIGKIFQQGPWRARQSTISSDGLWLLLEEARVPPKGYIPMPYSGPPLPVYKPDTQVTLFHRQPDSQGVVGPFGIAATTVEFGSFSADSRWLAYHDQDELLVLDLTTLAIVERYPYPMKNGEWRHLRVDFLDDPDWILIHESDTVIHRSANQFVTLPGSSGYIELFAPDYIGPFASGPSNPHEVAAFRQTDDGKSLVHTMARWDVTADPPRETLTSIHPKGWEVGLQSDRHGNLLITEKIPDSWEKCRDWIRRLSSNRIAPPAWMSNESHQSVSLVDAHNRVGPQRQLLTNHPVHFTPSGEYIVCMYQNYSDKVTLSVYSSRQRQRWGTWGLLALVMTFMVATRVRSRRIQPSSAVG